MWNSKFRKQLVRAVSVFSAVALVIPYVPGQAKTSTKSKVTEIQLSSPLSETGRKVTSTLTMKKGSKFQIKTKAFSKSNFTYKSSRPKIAVVSKKGVIKAKKKGKAKITVSPKGNKKIKAIIKLNVTNSLKKVKKISLNKKSIVLTLDKNSNSQILKAKIKSPKKPTNRKINWISADKKIATVSKTGTVTAKSAGITKITAVAADGRGAKAVCRVTVSKNSTVEDSPTPTGSAEPGGVTSTSSPSIAPSSFPSVEPSVSPSATPVAEEAICISGLEDRTGIKQGESVQLTAKGTVSGEEKTDVTWSVNSIPGVQISESGLLTVAADTQVSKKITVTVKMNENAMISDTASLTVVENRSVLAENQMQLNKITEENPQGLTYRVADDGTVAYSTVEDPQRGSVTRIDEAVGYKNDMIAWLTVDPLYAGKTVSISAYIKYDEMDTRDSIGLVLNERWSNSNPAAKWNAAPNTWHYISGTFTLPEYKDYRYDGTKNNLFLSRFVDLGDDEHPVYYLSDLVISVEKAQIESVNLSLGQEEDTIYQDHELQCSAEVIGTGNPLQKVKYSIEPEVENVSISEDGLLTVGKKAEAGAVINIRAEAFEDPEKYAIKTLTVLPQTIDSINVSAEGNLTEIYQGNTLQMKAELTASGEPDTSVLWSIFPAVDGVSISETGLVTVAENVVDGTDIHIKAASVFDPSQSSDYVVTVRANKVNGVTVRSAGDKTTVSSDLPLNLNAEVDVTGTPSKDVTWTVLETIEGVSITSNGNNCTLSVADTVSDDTTITIRAASKFDPTQYGEIIVTVLNSSKEEFDMNKLTVEYWEDFLTKNTEELVAEDGIISYQEKTLDESFLAGYSLKRFTKHGIDVVGENLSASKRASYCLNGRLGSQDDYLQFKLENTEDKDKDYTLSFMFRFREIAVDSTDYSSDFAPSDVDYELPLKLVSLDENNNEVVLQENIKVPYRCFTSVSKNKEYLEVIQTVTVPAGKIVRLQLKLDGDLPLCQVPTRHTGAEQEYHPVGYSIDNIAISSGSTNTITVKKGETYQLQLDTLADETVEYQTNSYLAHYTHSDQDTECSRFDTIVASVDGNGLITASEVGETALIAVIKNADGEVVRRKQCIVKVEE